MSNYRFFLNRSNNLDGYTEAMNGRFFVDKSLLIDFVNSKISTKEKWICVSRPRRFGKTMALEMLAAYYTKGIQADSLFDNLQIAQASSYHRHLNTHNTIYINFNDYFETCERVADGILAMSERLLMDLQAAYPGVLGEVTELSLALDMVQQATGEKFIFLIDEWDCVFRFKKGQWKEQEHFLTFLKLLFKDKSYVELVYMTGILPIKKYNTGSALNMFREYTMLDPKKLGRFFGFLPEEVAELCKDMGQSMEEELKLWYDGYYMENTGYIYNPRSVVEALEEGICKDYWSRTGGYSELEDYITLNFDGLGEAVTHLVAGDSITVNVLGFSNDLDSFQDKDEVITALIHLGYLTYEQGYVRIPNHELREEFANTVKKLSWGIISRLLNQSRQLLRATLDQDAEKVAQGLEDVHDDMHEFKEYNNEHTLKCVIHLAYYAAADDYQMYFEESAGKGVADCIMIPRKAGLPGIVLELKYNGSTEQAIQQIMDRNYVARFQNTVKQVLFVEINYDKKTKQHECEIVVKQNYKGA